MHERLTVIQRLTRLGIAVIAGHAGEEAMIAFDRPNGLGIRPHLEPCDRCGESASYDLIEPVLRYVPLMRRMMYVPHRLGHFCNVCGWFMRTTAERASTFLGAKLPKRGSLFDFLDRLEQVQVVGIDTDDPETLERLERMLEARLAEIRARKEALRLKKGEGDPFRG